MIIFLKKMILFVLPLCLVLMFPFVVLYLSREYVSYKDVVKTQEKYPEALFGFAYNGASFYPYKEFLTKRIQPHVIALGTSRVMQFRKEFFTASTTFVNAGGAGKTMKDMETFVEALPEGGSLKVIILGLDEEVVTGSISSSEYKNEHVLPFRIAEVAIVMSRRIYLDYVSRKFTLENIVKARGDTYHIGLSALLHNDGFRTDGSYRYGGASTNSSRREVVKEQIDVYTESIKNKSSALDVAKKNREVNLETLERILFIAKEKGIQIIGFIPPSPTSIYEAKLVRDEMQVSTSEALSALFARHNAPFFDLSSIKTFGGKETEFADYNHGTDVMYLRITLYLYEHAKNLNGMVDASLLKDVLKKTSGDFLDF